MTEHLVFAVDSTFLPERIEATIGDTIVWENRTGVNKSAVRANQPAFDTGVIRPGDRSAAIPVPPAGEYEYGTIGADYIGTLVVVE